MCPVGGRWPGLVCCTGDRTGDQGRAVFTLEHRKRWRWRSAFFVVAPLPAVDGLDDSAVLADAVGTLRAVPRPLEQADDWGCIPSITRFRSAR